MFGNQHVEEHDALLRMQGGQPIRGQLVKPHVEGLAVRSSGHQVSLWGKQKRMLELNDRKRPINTCFNEKYIDTLTKWVLCEAFYSV